MTRIDRFKVVCTAFGAAVILALSACGGRAVAAAPAPAQSPSPEGIEFFEKHVRPVLADNCYKCHSTTSGKSKGDLLLDTRDALLKGGENGPAVVPGDPDKSRLIEAVRYANPDLQMPPKGKGQPLAPEQVADLVAWVKMGAPDPRTSSSTGSVAGAAGPSSGYDFDAARKQWAFHPPVEPAVPEVRQQDWAKGAIDRYILARLEEKGLRPAPAADRRALVRRAYFDLIGIPPSPEEVDAFVNDASPDAFAKIVDRLLASPLYGQRWGRHWLDVVRYTDVQDARDIKGGGPLPMQWRYRDWVVDAFNRDMPYDQFVANQIAGDLLPPPRPGGINAEGIIATGLYAIGEWGPGDADREKMLTDIADDQVDVTGRAFLGLTLACARCHDHKFDPIPQADYYSLAGIFFNTHILPNPGSKTAGVGMIKIPLVDPSQSGEKKKIDQEIAATQQKIESVKDEGYAALARSALGETDKYLLAAAEYSRRPAEKRAVTAAQFAAERKLNAYAFTRWAALLAREAGDAGGVAVGEKLMGQPLRDIDGTKGLSGWRNNGPSGTPVALANGTDRPITLTTLTLPPHSVTVHPSPTSGAAVAWTSPIGGAVRVSGRVVDADPHCGDGIEWRLTLRSAGGDRQLLAGAIPNGGAQSFAEAGSAGPLARIEVKVGDVLEAAVLPKADYACDTTVVEFRIEEIEGGRRTWDLAADVAPDILAGGKSNPHADGFGNPGVWRFLETPIQPPLSLPAGSAIAGFIARAHEGAADDSGATLAAAAAEVRESLVRQRDAKAPRADGTASGAAGSAAEGAAPEDPAFLLLTDPHGPFWAEARKDEANLPGQVRQTLTQLRAKVTELQKEAVAAVPTAYGLSEGGCPQSVYEGIHDPHVMARGRYDRLGELVPRRFPRLLAGDEQTPVGSRTSQSGRLELAQWVASGDNPLTARVMVNRIWQHHFGEGIVRTPNNYGKLGTPPTHPELLDYLALRFVRSGWSVKAMHREMMLSAAYQQSAVPDPATFKADPENLLVGRMSRHRLEAEALRDALLAETDSLDPTAGGPAVGDITSHRRTLYLMTIRSDRSSYRMLFDAPDPVSVAEKRIDSTVAPQALFLLNSPFATQQAKALAAKVTAAGTGGERAAIDRLYPMLFSRPATPREVEIGLAALRRWSGEQPAVSPEAWEQYCQVLLCSNEFIYVD